MRLRARLFRPTSFSLKQSVEVLETPKEFAKRYSWDRMFFDSLIEAFHRPRFEATLGMAHERDDPFL